MYSANTKSIPWQKTPTLLPLICLIIGILSADYFNFNWNMEKSVLIAIALFISSGAALTFAYHYKYASILIIACVSLIFFSLGLTSYQYAYLPNHKNWYGHNMDSSVWIQLKIDRPAETKAKTIRYNTKVIAYYDSASGWKNSKGNIDVYVYKNEHAPLLHQNDIISIPSSSLSEITFNNNPYSFNYKRFAEKKNKFHQAFISYEDIIVNHLSTPDDLTFIQKTNKSILNAIYENVHDSMTASMMAAVLINERAEMDKDIWEDYSKTGVAHIIAISGMHITLFVAILFFVLSFITDVRFNTYKYCVAIGFVWIYIALTGLPPSAVRAGVMFTIIGISIILRRPHVAINSLLATAFVSLIFVPQWIWDVGFQLSFLSVSGILIFYEKIKNLIPTRSKIIEFVWNTVALSISVQIALTPILIFYFHQFSIWSIIANIPAALYSTLFMIISLIIVVFGQFKIDLTPLGNLNAFLTYRFNDIIRWMSDHSFDGFHKLYLSFEEMLAWYLLIALLTFYVFTKKKKYINLSIVALALVIGLFTYRQYTQNNQDYLLLYSSNSSTIIDIVKSKKAFRYYTDTITKTDSIYAIKPHEISASLELEKSEEIKDNTLLDWNDKKIFILENDIQSDSIPELKVNYIILTNKKIKLTPELLTNFNANTWIIAAEIPNYYAENFKKSFDEKNINYRYIRDSGSWCIRYNEQ